jgi:hypothetical protein
MGGWLGRKYGPRGPGWCWLLGGHGDKENGLVPRGILSLCFYSKKFKFTRMNLNKNGLPEFKKIEIKYSFEGFKLGNNLPYRNFS